jgi:hypothetical protein
VSEIKSKAFNRLVKLAAQVWTALCAAYFLWEALSYRGIFSRLAEFQISKFGTYAPLVTYLAILAVVVVPVWIIARLLLKKAEDSLELPALMALKITQARRLRLFLTALGATTFAITLGFVVYAVWLLPTQSGTLQTISASEFGAVPIKEGPARVVGGDLGTIIFFGQDWFVGDDRMAFAPYRTEAANDGLAHIFVQLEATDRNELKKITQRPFWSGIIVEGGLPGPVRVLFNYIGVGLSDPYYTLYQNEYSLKIRYWLQAIQWFLLSAFLFVLVVLQARTIKSLTDRQNDLSS